MDELPVWLGAVLFPGAQPDAHWLGGSRRRFVGIPSSASPRQLVPWTPVAAVGAASRATDDRARRRSAIDGLAVLGLVAVAPFDRRRRLVIQATGDSLLGHMRAQIDQSIRHAIIMCGPARANQKPVLQLFDRWGRTRAFVKVGWNPLTRSLLSAEQGTLDHLAGVDLDLTIPRVLGSGEFANGAWLAISPVGVQRRHAPSHETMVRSARAIEASADEWKGAFGDSAFALDLVDRAADLTSAGPVVRELVDRHRDRQIRLVAAHGDFVPWNVLSGSPRPAVWDWERYATGLPTGFDRLHYTLQVQLYRRKLSTADAVSAVAGRLDELIPELDPADADLSLDCYLAELMCRYEHDAAESGLQALATRAIELAGILHQRHSFHPQGPHLRPTRESQ